MSNRFSLSVENEQADAERDGRIRLASPYSQARKQGKIVSPVQLATSRIGNHIRLIHTLLCLSDEHTYINSYTVLYCSTQTRVW